MGMCDWFSRGFYCKSYAVAHVCCRLVSLGPESEPRDLLLSQDLSPVSKRELTNNRSLWRTGIILAFQGRMLAAGEGYRTVSHVLGKAVAPTHVCTRIFIVVRWIRTT